MVSLGGQILTSLRCNVAEHSDDNSGSGDGVSVDDVRKPYLGSNLGECRRLLYNPRVTRIEAVQPVFVDSNTDGVAERKVDCAGIKDLQWVVEDGTVWIVLLVK